MKGNIAPGDKIFKISSKSLSEQAKATYSGKEIKKVKLSCKITIKKDLPITIFVKPDKEYEHYKNVSVTLKSDIVPVPAINQPLTKEKIIAQFSKTTDTPFEFSKIDVDLDNDLYIPKISEINALRRETLEKLEDLVSLRFTRVPVKFKEKSFDENEHKYLRYSLLLEELSETFDYSKLEDVDRVYIPLKYFGNTKYKPCIDSINSRFDTYIYMPTILTANYSNIMKNIITYALSNNNISGFVFSNINTLHTMKDSEYKNYDFIANYTLNIYNDYSAYELSRMGIDTITLSPELNKTDIQNLSSNVDKELIVYGKLKLMTTKYCLLGGSNLCYPTCEVRCRSNSKFYLKERMGFKFRVIPDNSQTITSIYNSKTLSINTNDLNINYARIDILGESLEEINNIIRTVKANKRFEGQDYTNGHINRDV